MESTATDARMAEAVAARDLTLIDELATLVNEVYAAAEQGLWADGTPRTTPTELADLVEAGQIVVARVNQRVVGVMRLQRLEPRVGEFGMLAAHPAHRGQGVGRELVRFAERWAREQGCTAMQLEVIVPRLWTHPSKEFLHAWYTRIGYRAVGTGQFEEHYPHLAPLLATPCDFVIYRKDLQD